MGLFDSLIKTVVDVVTIPLDIVADVGALTEGEILPNTRETIEDIAQDGANIVKDIVNLDL